MKSVIYKFDPAIYPFPLLVTKRFDAEEMAKRFWVMGDDDKTEEATDDFKPNGFVTARILSLCDKETYQRYYIILIIRPKHVRYGIITHEAIHLANAYLQYLGVSRPRAYEDEEYAYFGGWVANCMSSVLNNDPELMKGVIFE